MKINSRAISTKRGELHRIATETEQTRIERARNTVIDYLAKGQIRKAVEVADKHKLLKEVPRKYLRQAADKILRTESSDSNDYLFAAELYSLLGDKKKVRQANKEADEAPNYQHTSSMDDIYYR